MLLPHFAMRRVIPAAALFGTLVLAACGGDSTGASGPYSASGTTGDVSATSAAFDAPAVESFNAVTIDIQAKTGASFALSPAPMVSAAIRRDERTAEGVARAIAARYVPTNSAASFSVAPIPSELLGKTLEWDAGTDTYVAGSRAGAPGNGVRFILYAVDPVTRRPVEPVNEVGYVDLSGGTTSFRAVVVSGSVTYLDYNVAASGSAGSATVTISGFATNGTNRADFDLKTKVDQTGQESLRLTADWKVTVPSLGFGINLHMTVDVTPGGKTIQLTLDAHGAHGQVTVTGSLAAGSGTFQVRVDGNLFATITSAGTTDPTITGANGQQLTEEDLAAVRNVFGVFGDTAGFFGGLVAPLGAVG